MTVSPKRPLDGNRQSKTDRNQEATGFASDASALPPVLFKLPNVASETKPAVSAQPNNQSPSMPLPGSTGVQSTPLGASDAVAGAVPPSNNVPPNGTSVSSAPVNSAPANAGAPANRQFAPRDPMAGIQVTAPDPAPVRQAAIAPAPQIAAQQTAAQQATAQQATAQAIAARPAPAPYGAGQHVAGHQDVAYPTAGQSEIGQPSATAPASDSGPNNPPHDAPGAEPQRRAFAGRSSADMDVRPAGRTWAEAVMAHRAVLSLLAVVIAVALWTSRGTSDSTDVDSMAEVDEAFEIETGDLATSFPSADSFATSSAAAGSSAGLPRAANSSSAAIDDSSEEHASVALNAPEPTTADADTVSRSISDRDRADATPSFGQSSVPASTVSSRTPSGLPSLEDLVSGPDGTDWETPASTAAPTNAAPPVRQGEAEFTGPEPSRTPAPVQDWLKYLPQTAPPVSSVE
ncbi:hypothetical protein K227x_10710 [Rubripirellula lacrimiformis]|uniref:Uncharacterized protein n=1 Tax=Rubripirellula lacrimiformis TaxID=1930273 RepID=A0A517N6D4_9BACT|nr:hypothetical protein [Rubripirellula lacrimiformis]QDT02693.1 hypothetical protein K227x_10710 [Rubripirellula lacrimiformis]